MGAAFLHPFRVLLQSHVLWAWLFTRSELPVLWCSIAMKIRMNEMTPEGKILNCGVVIIGKTAREIV